MIQEKQKLEVKSVTLSNGVQFIAKTWNSYIKTGTEPARLFIIIQTIQSPNQYDQDNVEKQVKKLHIPPNERTRNHPADGDQIWQI